MFPNCEALTTVPQSPGRRTNWNRLAAAIRRKNRKKQRFRLHPWMWTRSCWGLMNRLWISLNRHFLCKISLIIEIGKYSNMRAIWYAWYSLFLYMLQMLTWYIEGTCLSSIRQHLRSGQASDLTPPSLALDGGSDMWRSSCLDCAIGAPTQNLGHRRRVRNFVCRVKLLILCNIV